MATESNAKNAQSTGHEMPVSVDIGTLHQSDTPTLSLNNGCKLPSSVCGSVSDTYLNALN